MNEADIILFVANNPPSDSFNRYLDYVDPKKLIPIVSKCDLISDRTNLRIFGKEVIYLSSVSGEGFDILKSKIVEIALNK